MSWLPREPAWHELKCFSKLKQYDDREMGVIPFRGAFSSHPATANEFNDWRANGKAETKIELPGNELIAAPRLTENRAPGSRSSNCWWSSRLLHSRRMLLPALSRARPRASAQLFEQPPPKSGCSCSSYR